MNKHSTRYFSNKQEKKVAKVVGGKQTANSGATKFSKGDVRSENWLFECKTKVKESQSITIYKDWLDKNAEEAFAMDKDYNALVFDFGDEHNPKTYYIVDEKTFLEMKNALEGKYYE